MDSLPARCNALCALSKAAPIQFHSGASTTKIQPCFSMRDLTVDHLHSATTAHGYHTDAAQTHPSQDDAAVAARADDFALGACKHSTYESL